MRTELEFLSPNGGRGTTLVIFILLHGDGLQEMGISDNVTPQTEFQIRKKKILGE